MPQGQLCIGEHDKTCVITSSLLPQDYVMMTKWLPTDAADTLPPNASHQVGVGAIVVNEEQKVLVVQEANGPLKGQGVWKMPTGLVHAGDCLVG